MIMVQDLSFSYSGKKLFSGLDLSLPGGGIYGFLGKNGAGKTTLLKIISGLLSPGKGVVRVAGQSPFQRRPEFLQDLFFIPEEFKMPGVSPERYMRLYAPFYTHFDPALYLSLLEKFELDPGADLSNCSFGQRKKCMISFGLAANCRLTLLDEPTNGLDIPSKSQFRRVLASVLTQDRSFIIATHQVRDLENLIDSVLILDNGKIIFNQTMEEIPQCLSLETLDILPGEGDVLYSEKGLDGYRVVRENTKGWERAMDLETLFNAVTQNPERIKAVFQRRQSHEEG